MLIGRFETLEYSDYNEIRIENAFSVSMIFEEIARLDLENESLAKINGFLIFRPYYIFEYPLIQ